MFFFSSDVSVFKSRHESKMKEIWARYAWKGNNVSLKVEKRVHNTYMYKKGVS